MAIKRVDGALDACMCWIGGKMVSFMRSIALSTQKMIKKLNLKSEDLKTDSVIHMQCEMRMCACVCMWTTLNFPLILFFLGRMKHVRRSLSPSRSLLLLLFSVNSVCFILVSEYIFTFFLFICGIWYKWTYGGIAPPPLPPLSSPPPNPYLYVCLSVRTTWLPFFAHSLSLSPSLSLTFRNASEPDSSF